MKTWSTAVGLLAVVGALHAQEMPQPGKEHAWLEALQGEWTTETEIVTEPGQPPMKIKGEASGRAVGGFWTVVDHRGDLGGMAFHGVLTLGYDAKRKKHVGTWVDSMNDYLWSYEGALDAEGKVLTLDTKGPNHKDGTITPFQEKITLKGPDAFTLTSAIETDGRMTPFLTVTYARKAKTEKR